MNLLSWLRYYSILHSRSCLLLDDTLLVMVLCWFAFLYDIIYCTLYDTMNCIMLIMVIIPIDDGQIN